MLHMLLVYIELIWYESNLTFAQDIVFHMEVYEYRINNAAENLPQVTVHTNASVIIRVRFISIFKNRCYETTIPDVWEGTYTHDQVE